jgi:hypothetical protein
MMSQGSWLPLGAPGGPSVSDGAASDVRPSRRRGSLRVLATFAGVAAASVLLALLSADALGADTVAPSAVVPSTPTDTATPAALEAAAIARALTGRLVAARAVVSSHQDLINDPSLGDKGLTAALVLEQTDARLAKASSSMPSLAPGSDRAERLLSLLNGAIKDVIDQSQATINAEGVGFKGFIPAVFARLVTARFNDLAAGEAQMRVTAPLAVVRNRSSRPDAWENEMIETYLSSPTWSRGAAIETAAVTDGRPAFRLLIPEYYAGSCLSCHGKPAGEIDRTGYPKEGAAEGDLGGVISVILW